MLLIIYYRKLYFILWFRLITFHFCNINILWVVWCALLININQAKLIFAFNREFEATYYNFLIIGKYNSEHIIKSIARIILIIYCVHWHLTFCLAKYFMIMTKKINMTKNFKRYYKKFYKKNETRDSDYLFY